MAALTKDTTERTQYDIIIETSGLVVLIHSHSPAY